MQRICLHYKPILLLGCGVAQLLLAYYFLFLEKKHSVSRLGSRRQPSAAVLDPAFRLSRQVDARRATANSTALPVDASFGIERLENGICSAGGYLCRQCDETGKFDYRCNLVPEIEYKPRYNVLRHAGAIYALAQFYKWRPDERVLDTLERSTRFLKTRCVSPVPGNSELLAVWSSPVLTGGNHPLKAKLGGAGLALVALSSFEHIKPNSTSLDELRGLGRFILYMQNSDGGFDSTYVPATGGRSDQWTSLYYPGEAALGLVMLYEIDPDPKWLRAAARAIAYLARVREGQSTVEADHWALLATARIFPVLDRCPEDLGEQAALVHARQICHSIMAVQQRSPRTGNVYGAFSSDGRTCPAATRLEGLQAALQFLEDGDHAFRAMVEESVRQGMAFLLRAQVASGEHTGAVPRAVSPLSKLHRQYSQSFNRRATEVRIDYVQHALSAMIQYHNRCYRQPDLTMQHETPAGHQGHGKG